MRNEWYGDKRDLLKWTSLLYLARREGIGRIFQVAMCTDPEPPHFEIQRLGGEPVECRDETTHATAHFHQHNDLNGIGALGERLGINIEVWPEPFTHVGRDAYFDRVYGEIRVTEPPTVWFFDPDTGIEPQGGANERHVRRVELAAAFELLSLGHYLACYQHAWHVQDWRGQARARLAEGLGRDENEVEVFTSVYATDVIVLVVEKRYRLKQAQQARCR